MQQALSGAAPSGLHAAACFVFHLQRRPGRQGDEPMAQEGSTPIKEVRSHPRGSYWLQAVGVARKAGWAAVASASAASASRPRRSRRSCAALPPSAAQAVKTSHQPGPWHQHGCGRRVARSSLVASASHLAHSPRRASPCPSLARELAPHLPSLRNVLSAPPQRVFRGSGAKRGAAARSVSPPQHL